MKKAVLNKKHIFILLAISLFMLLLPLISITTSVSFAETTALGGNIIIRAINNGNVIEEDRQESFEDGIVHIYKWRDLGKTGWTINLKYQHDEDNLPPPYNPEDGASTTEEYTFSVTVEYLKGYLDGDVGFNSDATHTVEKVGGERKHLKRAQLDNVDKIFDFCKGITATNTKNQVVNIKDWGIYRFKLIINGAEQYSDYYFIEPDNDVADAPVIKAKVTNSENSMHDSYILSLENQDAFQFVDGKNITWYVMGESKDGTLYALTNQDLADPRFAECTASLYTNIDRTGHEFLFNDNEIAGKWNIWCEYKNTATGVTVESENNLNVETGKDFNVITVLWIAGGLTVLISGVVVVLAIVRSKKDKVW